MPIPSAVEQGLAATANALLLGLTRLVTGAQGRWVGCPPSAEQRIYFANHQSHLDLMMIWAALPRDLRAITRPVAARDYWSGGLRHWLTTAVFNAVYVTRRRTAEDTSDPLAPLIEALESGDSLILFPEGTRGHQVDPGPFKSGLFHLAERFPDVKLIPAWIDNVQRVMPKGEIVPVPILCSVTFGSPINLEAGENKSHFLDRARQAIMALRNT